MSFYPNLTNISLQSVSPHSNLIQDPKPEPKKVDPELLQFRKAFSNRTKSDPAYNKVLSEQAGRLYKSIQLFSSQHSSYKNICLNIDCKIVTGTENEKIFYELLKDALIEKTGKWEGVKQLLHTQNISNPQDRAYCEKIFYNIHSDKTYNSYFEKERNNINKFLCNYIAFPDQQRVHQGNFDALLNDKNEEHRIPSQIAKAMIILATGKWKVEDNPHPPVINLPNVPNFQNTTNVDSKPRQDDLLRSDVEEKRNKTLSLDEMERATKQETIELAIYNNTRTLQLNLAVKEKLTFLNCWPDDPISSEHSQDQSKFNVTESYTDQQFLSGNDPAIQKEVSEKINQYLELDEDGQVQLRNKIELSISDSKKALQLNLAEKKDMISTRSWSDGQISVTSSQQNDSKMTESKEVEEIDWEFYIVQDRIDDYNELDDRAKALKRAKIEIDIARGDDDSPIWEQVKKYLVETGAWPTAPVFSDVSNKPEQVKSAPVGKVMDTSREDEAVQDEVSAYRAPGKSARRKKSAEIQRLLAKYDNNLPFWNKVKDQLKQSKLWVDAQAGPAPKVPTASKSLRILGIFFKIGNFLGRNDRKDVLAGMRKAMTISTDKSSRSEFFDFSLNKDRMQKCVQYTSKSTVKKFLEELAELTKLATLMERTRLLDVVNDLKLPGDLMDEFNEKLELI